MRVLILHGPNLNLLGERQPEIYGTQTLAEIDAAIVAAAESAGHQAHCEQYSGEGAIIDALHASRTTYDGVIINPGAYAHYSYAIADAIAAIGIPVVEVHLSNIASRESFRRTSVTAAACRAVVGGLGARGYVLALHALAEVLAG
ncbi:MAG TPA: type II 3-dehydroquinate dehydratase [Candidatus Cybelea sp.]|jgi:3-dehydroquinate dehydratase-2|nr:type II 3-dehydroquinate dehydratase [Candidatus Cybelea sp.]